MRVYIEVSRKSGEILKQEIIDLDHPTRVEVSRTALEAYRVVLRGLSHAVFLDEEISPVSGGVSASIFKDEDKG